MTSSVSLSRAASDGKLPRYDASSHTSCVQDFKKPGQSSLTPLISTSYIRELLQEAEILTQHRCNFAAKQVLDRIPEHLPREHQISLSSRTTAELHDEIPRKIQEYKHLLPFLNPDIDKTPAKLSPVEKKLKEAEVLAKHIHFDKAISLFQEVKDQLKAPRDLPQSLLYIRSLLGLSRLYLMSSQESTTCTQEAQAELEIAYQNASGINWEEKTLHEKKEVYGQLLSCYSILHIRMTVQRANGEDYYHIEHRVAECKATINGPRSPLPRTDAARLAMSRVPAVGSAKTQKVFHQNKADS